MRTSITALVLVPAVALALAACGSSGSSESTSGAGPACPTEAVDVVVSVDQWGDVVQSLGGACANVTTVIKGSSIDPHDYEPTAADIAKFSDAEVVVVNGVDYDHWAEQAVDNVKPAPALVDGGVVTGVEEGENPHLWYGPDHVEQIAAAVTKELKAASPDAAAYFDARAAEWATSMKPYYTAINELKDAHAGAPYVATESVFDYMADAIGLENVTPQGYRNAAANESDPSPGDVAELDRVLEAKEADVLIYNAQTEGSIPEQNRRAADAAAVPVVEVTETVAPGFDTFVAWQTTQLEQLKKALGGR